MKQINKIFILKLNYYNTKKVKDKLIIILFFIIIIYEYTELNKNYINNVIIKIQSEEEKKFPIIKIEILNLKLIIINNMEIILKSINTLIYIVIIFIGAGFKE